MDEQRFNDLFEQMNFIMGEFKDTGLTPEQTKKVNQLNPHFVKAWDLMNTLCRYYEDGRDSSNQRVKDTLSEVDDFWKELDGEE